MLAFIKNVAEENNLAKVSLMVALENKDAKRFYECHGFKASAIYLESNNRVAQLGLGHRRMVKELNR
jgi:ribosomal protein S18 acetylase RimI-like enzyme